MIENAITRFSQNRVGNKRPVFVTLAPALPQIPWKGSALRQFLQFFLYESLLTSDANAPIEIALRRRSLLKDLTAFVGIQPSYWVQLRVSGRGLRITDNLSRISSPKSATAAKNGSALTAGRTPGNFRHHRRAEAQNGFLPGIEPPPAALRSATSRGR